MPQKHNYNTEKILTEKPLYYRNANRNTEKILKELRS